MQHLLPRRARRHHHRRAARGRAHQRRDRAAAVHRAQQPVLEHQPQRADGEPAGRHLPVRAQPLRGLAVSSPGPARSSSRSRCWRSASSRARLAVIEASSHESNDAVRRRSDRSPHAAAGAAGLRREDLDPRPRISSTATSQALKNDQPRRSTSTGDRVHRPVGLRQVDAAARAQPHVRALSGPARDRRGAARRREHPRRRSGPQPAARAHRHGVPEADAVPDVDLRQHRLRHPALRAAAEVASWTSASRGRCAARRCGTR